jgi:hypothetical protein
MTRHVRFADFEHAHRAAYREISANLILPAPQLDARGRREPLGLEAVSLTLGEALRLVQPYVSRRFFDQVKAVVPLAVYLALFQLLILRHAVEDSWLITAGLFAVIVGLMLFMEGLARGLMPFGEIIGQTLPRRSPLPVVLVITLLLGIGVTFAEPAIGALRAAGQNVSVEQAPYLFALLGQWSQALVLVVGASVGLAAVLGTLRFLYGWSLKPFVYLALGPVLLVSLFAAGDPELVTVTGLAWDAGAVTTGPVTVPLVLSLGIGIAAAAGKGDTGLSGFGIVTLASLLPIAGVLLLAFYVSATVTPEEIVAAARAAQGEHGTPQAWYERSPGKEIILGVRAILPLIAFLFIVLTVVLRERLRRPGEIFYGIGLTVVGMCVFNVGLTYGLSKLGGSAGELVPAAFMAIDGVPTSPMYLYGVGLALALAFAWFMGFGATVAEPALNALGATTEGLTDGVLKKKALIYAVSTGVAFGIALGLVRLIFELPLIWLLIPSYLVAIVLTVLSEETFVNVAWDSAGVTTGPITVPLVLAMGLGFGGATNAVEGFGILSMASVGPILTVLATGLWARFQLARQSKVAATGTPITAELEAQAIV